LKLYRGAPHYWSEDKIRKIILFRRHGTHTTTAAEQRDPLRSTFNNGHIDRRSVMLYTIPPQLVVGDPIGFPLNSRLSKFDKEFAAHLYPQVDDTDSTSSRSTVPTAPLIDDGNHQPIYVQLLLFEYGIV
jgi:hypothetical protein